MADEDDFFSVLENAHLTSSEDEEPEDEEPEDAAAAPEPKERRRLPNGEEIPAELDDIFDDLDGAFGAEDEHKPPTLSRLKKGAQAYDRFMGFLKKMNDTDAPSEEEDLFGDGDDDDTQPPPLKRMRKVGSDDEEMPPSSPLADMTGGGGGGLDDLLGLGADDESEEEEGGGGDAAASGGGGDAAASVSTSERTIDVRAHELITAYPPHMVFVTGKSRASEVPLVLVGDLVRDMSCPLNTFRVVVRPMPHDEESEVPAHSGGMELLFALRIVKVVKGPIQAAAKIASEKAAALGKGSIEPEPPRATVRQMRTALRGSRYYPRATTARAKYIESATKAVAEASAGRTSSLASAVITQAALDRHAPASGDTHLSWACRNMLEPAEFFARANIVGGAAVRELGGATADTEEWDMLLKGGDSLTLLGDKAMDEARVVDLLRKVHFANNISEERATELHLHLDVDAMSDESRATVYCTVSAAAIFHSLPPASATGDERARNSVVWSDSGAPCWPDPVVQMLRERNIVVDRTPTQRWFACRRDAVDYYGNVKDAVNSVESLRYVRAEVDDDYDNIDCITGYMQMLRDTITETDGNIIVVTLRKERRRFLSRRVASHDAAFMIEADCRGQTLRRGTSVWVDRAHQLSADSLMSLVRTFGPRSSTFHLAGSMWSYGTSADRFATTMFAQMFEGAAQGSKRTLTTTVAKFKAATGNPITDLKVSSTSRHFIITRAQGLAIPRELREAFPHAIPTYLEEFDTIFTGAPTVIVVLDDTWTREDLILVWHGTLNEAHCIWFHGNGSHLWEKTLERTARRSSIAGVLMNRA